MTTVPVAVSIGRLARETSFAIDRHPGFHDRFCFSAFSTSTVARCYNLRAAYKQFAVHGDDREVLRMAVRDPGSKVPRLLGFNTLPFGAVESVAGFLRVSLAVWYIGVVGQICRTAFYNDSSVLSRKELFANTSWCVESLFLFGFKYACEGKICYLQSV